MAEENCTHDCSSCGKNCEDRKDKFDFSAKLNAASKVTKVIAVASGIMFYVDSSSGGTDIIALIVKKFSNIKIGKALLITDVLIVLVGGVLSGLTIFLSSFLGLLIKTLGIDLVISIISKGLKKKGSEVK